MHTFNLWRINKGFNIRSRLRRIINFTTANFKATVMFMLAGWSDLIEISSYGCRNGSNKVTDNSVMVNFGYRTETC